MEADNTVYTIGHSTHPLEMFVDLLKQHGVGLLADVRSVPFSRWQPQYNQNALAPCLSQHGIDYLFLGKELGARSEDRSCYRGGRVQYDLLSRTKLFRAGIERVKVEAANNRIALMCAEKEPLECHRTLLIGRSLDKERIPVVHIHADARLESYDDSMARLLRLRKLEAETLFQSAAEMIDQACQEQEDLIAYRDDAVGAKQ
jgi:uncharacterized protein (DUF488 family)